MIGTTRALRTAIALVLSAVLAMAQAPPPVAAPAPPPPPAATAPGYNLKNASLLEVIDIMRAI